MNPLDIRTETARQLALRMELAGGDREAALWRLNQAELARALGVTRQAIHHWVAAGVIEVDPDDGRIDARLAVAELLARGSRMAQAGLLAPVRDALAALQARAAETERLLDEATESQVRDENALLQLSEVLHCHACVLLLERRQFRFIAGELRWWLDRVLWDEKDPPRLWRVLGLPDSLRPTELIPQGFDDSTRPDSQEGGGFSAAEEAHHQESSDA